MSYNYSEERHKLFTEEGQTQFLKIRDRTKYLLGLAGAVTAHAIMRTLSGDLWFDLACIDRLVELGEIREITGPNVWGQHRVFISGTDIQS